MERRTEAIALSTSQRIVSRVALIACLTAPHAATSSSPETACLSSVLRVAIHCIHWGRSQYWHDIRFRSEGGRLVKQSYTILCAVRPESRMMRDVVLGEIASEGDSTKPFNGQATPSSPSLLLLSTSSSSMSSSLRVSRQLRLLPLLTLVL